MLSESNIGMEESCEVQGRKRKGIESGNSMFLIEKNEANEEVYTSNCP